MGFVFDNFTNRRKINLTAKPHGIVDRLTSVSEVNNEVAVDEVANLLSKILSLYRSKIFPSVAKDIKTIMQQASKNLDQELSIDKTIRVMNVSSDILYVISNNENTVPTTVKTRPQYPIFLGDVTTLEPDIMKRFLDSVTETNLNEGWKILSEIISGNGRLASLNYGMVNSHLTEIVYALALSLDEEKPPTNTRATIGNYRILVRWIKESMHYIMNRYVNAHTTMVSRDVLIHTILNDNIFIVSDVAKSLASTLNQGGAEYNMNDIIHGAVLNGYKTITSKEVLEKLETFNNEWKNFIKGASIAKRTASVKHLKRAYNDLFTASVSNTNDDDYISIKKDRFNTLMNELTQYDLANIEDCVATIYGKVFYPESGYLRFIGYIKAYKKMDRGFSFDDMVAMALTEMAADLLLDSCEIYETTEKFTHV